MPASLPITPSIYSHARLPPLRALDKDVALEIHTTLKEDHTFISAKLVYGRFVLQDSNTLARVTCRPFVLGILSRPKVSLNSASYRGVMSPNFLQTLISCKTPNFQIEIPPCSMFSSVMMTLSGCYKPTFLPTATPYGSQQLGPRATHFGRQVRWPAHFLHKI